MKTLISKKMISVLGMSALIAGFSSSLSIAQPYTYPGQVKHSEASKSEPIKEYRTVENTFDKK